MVQRFIESSVWASELGAARLVFLPGEIICRCRLGRLGGVVGRHGHKGTLQKAKAVCKEKIMVVLVQTREKTLLFSIWMRRHNDDDPG
jgi:hypothetical protein